MPYVTEYEYVLRNSENKIFNFYLNEENHIEYVASNSKNQWIEKKKIFEESTLDFAIDMDKKDQIYIVSYSSIGDLHYHSYQNSLWSHQHLFNYPRKLKKVYYPIIKLCGHKIHIFYYLLHEDQHNHCYLIHLKSGKEKWVKNQILSSHFSKLINPFNVFIHKNRIYILFCSNIEGNDQIYLTFCEQSTEQWQQPLQLTHTKDQKLYLHGLFDHNDYLHITWSSFDEKGMTVQYLKYNIKEADQKINILSLSEKLNCSFPILIQYNGILWNAWTQINKLFSCYSLDSGKNWSKPKLIKKSVNAYFKRYRFISSHISDQKSILCDYLYGSLFPNIQFMGFGGDINDDIST